MIAAVATPEPTEDDRRALIHVALDTAYECHLRLAAVTRVTGGHRTYGGLLSFGPSDEAALRSWAAERGLDVLEDVMEHAFLGNSGTIRSIRVYFADRDKGYLAWIQWPLVPHAEAKP